MMTQAKIWWLERSPRERWLIGVMIALTAMLILWLGLVRPLDRAVTRAATRYGEAVTEIAGIAAKSAALKIARAKPPIPRDSDIIALVRGSAEAAGFTLTRADPGDGNRIMIAIVSAKSPALFAWIAALERSGFFVERGVMRTNSDATLGFDATIRARVG